jgi:hypothetical protein
MRRKYRNIISVHKNRAAIEELNGLDKELSSSVDVVFALLCRW